MEITGRPIGDIDLVFCWFGSSNSGVGSFQFNSISSSTLSSQTKNKDKFGLGFPCMALTVKRANKLIDMTLDPMKKKTTT